MSNLDTLSVVLGLIQIFEQRNRITPKDEYKGAINCLKDMAEELSYMRNINKSISPLENMEEIDEPTQPSNEYYEKRLRLEQLLTDAEINLKKVGCSYGY